MEPLSEPDLISKGAVLALISELFPWTGRFERTPMRDYASSVFDVAPHYSDCDDRGRAMSLLRSWVGRAARRRGFSEGQAVRFEDEITAAPVLQTGPHLHLLIEPDAFYTHLFSLMGLLARGRRCYISYGCSTVKFVERGRKGPAWLRLDGQAINVFGLSRSKMIPYSILGRNNGYRFQLQNADRPGEEPDAVSRLRSVLPDGEFPSAAEAIKAANLGLWNRYFDSRIDFLQLDDCDVVDLAIDHLSDDQSWLRTRLIEDRPFASQLLECIDRLAETAWQGWLKNSTHYFWGCSNGQLFPLWLDGAVLRARSSEEMQIAFSPAGLIEALRNGQIIPNLLLVFIMTSILPGVRVLGGSRHTIYYPLMRYAICEALLKHGRDSALLAALSQDVRPGAWGHRVISSACEPFSLLDAPGAGNIAMLLDRFGQMAIEDASGSLSSFTQDPLWAGLAVAFASGIANADDPQWAFS
ncbi:hypothetical protein G6L08_33140 [Agrobacterium rhizogenes]|nr:hypothetical protein [Rhizobium rhizogenes]NTG31999.1 hypothetical protein [Rhizobium rhizogenes]